MSGFPDFEVRGESGEGLYLTVVPNHLRLRIKNMNVNLEGVRADFCEHCVFNSDNITPRSQRAAGGCDGVGMAGATFRTGREWGLLMQAAAGWGRGWMRLKLWLRSELGSSNWGCGNIG